jgi:hypothetical protein
MPNNNFIDGTGKFQQNTENAGVITYGEFSQAALNTGTIAVSAIFTGSSVNSRSTSSIHNAAVNKLLLCDFECMSSYDKIVFCDVDALWTNNPNKMFECIDDHHISFGRGFFVDRDPLITDPLNYWGADLLNPDEILQITVQQTIAANTGVFGLSSSTSPLLREVFDLIQQNPDKIGSCLEQPFLNVHAWRQNKYNRALKQHVFNGAAKPSFLDDYSRSSEEWADLCVAHFANGVGKFGSKHDLMNSFAAKHLGLLV